MAVRSLYVGCAGLMSNGFLAGQLAAPAWLRLGVLSCAMVLGYGVVYRKRRISNPAEGLTAELLGSGAITSEVRTQRYACVLRLLPSHSFRWIRYKYVYHGTLRSPLTRWISFAWYYCNMDSRRSVGCRSAPGFVTRCVSQTLLIESVSMPASDVRYCLYSKGHQCIVNKNAQGSRSRRCQRSGLALEIFCNPAVRPPSPHFRHPQQFPLVLLPSRLARSQLVWRSLQFVPAR